MQDEDEKGEGRHVRMHTARERNIRAKTGGKRTYVRHCYSLPLLPVIHFGKRFLSMRSSTKSVLADEGREDPTSP